MENLTDIREIFNILFGLFVIGLSARFWRKSKKQNEQISSNIEQNIKLIEQTRFLITKTTDLLEEYKKIYRDKASTRNKASVRQVDHQDLDLKESAKELSQYIDDPELQQKITDEFGFSYYEDNCTDNGDVSEKKEDCTNMEEHRNEINSF
jgi:hypothetical protein